MVLVNFLVSFFSGAVFSPSGFNYVKLYCSSKAELSFSKSTNLNLSIYVPVKINLLQGDVFTPWMMIMSGDIMPARHLSWHYIVSYICPHFFFIYPTATRERFSLEYIRLHRGLKVRMPTSMLPLRQQRLCASFTSCMHLGEPAQKRWICP
jgi:hypothetical protein